MNKQKQIVDFLLSNKVLYHVLFWVVTLLLYTLIDGLNTGFYRITFIKYLALLPAQVLAAYSLAYYLTPKFWARKKYFQFFLGFVFSAYVFSALGRWLMIYVAEPFIRTDFQQESLLEILFDPLYLLSVYFPGIYLFVFIFYALKNVKARYEEKHHLAVLQKEKTSNELQFLKTQIHPHFLFNTLNNLYALAIEQSPKVPEVILKLSEMLDYMLYTCADPLVPVEKEIQFIETYIELESLRYGEKLDLQFDHDIGETSYQMAPLLLLSLVENAFKHGVRGNKEPHVRICLKIEKQRLHFKVINNKPKLLGSELNKKKNGIGTTNIQKQLDLLYPQQYDLHTEDEADKYSVSLSIPLS
ncbi:MAG: histidine kinase [Bacteroidota bacterium]